MHNIIENNSINHSVDFVICFFSNLKSTKATPRKVTWENFCKNLSNAKVSESKETFLFSPCKLNENQRRANENVVEVSLLVFDIDDPKGKTADEIIGLVSEYDAILHSTWSHSPENPRYRLILRLLRPVASSKFKAVRDGFLLFNSELASIIDKACSDPARAYYLFSYPSERTGYAIFETNHGRPVNPDRFLITNTAHSSLHNVTPFSNVSGGGFAKGSRNVALTKFVGGLIGQGKSFQETLALSLEWNKTLNPPLDYIEVYNTHQSIWKTHLRNHPELTQQLPTTNSSHTNKGKKFTIIPASDLLASPPAEREWLFTEFLPKKIVATIIAAGATGKSFFAMHIAIALGAGSSLFKKFIPSNACKVVFISGEDDKLELHRRIHAATQGMPASFISRIKSNVHFIDISDACELFTYKPPSGEVIMTDAPTNLIESIKENIGEEIGLVIVDPVSRFRGGEENSAGDTTRFVQALQYIRDQLNTTVLTLHHVNKGAKSNGAGANNARGSSAFIDGVRLVYELNVLSEDEVKKQYGAAGTIPRLVTLNCVKTNYSKPIESLTLSKKSDGSLELFTVQSGQHQTLAILQEIKTNQLSKTQFKQKYGSVNGTFGLSEKALLKKLSEFERQGLITIPNRGSMQLTKSGDSLLAP